MQKNEHLRIGRNDPCFCSSGKKYKHCHGSATASSPDAVYERIRRYDGESAHHLLGYARKKYGEHVLERAWTEYRFSDGTPFEISGPEGDPFTRWFMFSRKQSDGKTLAEMFLAEKGSGIDPDLKTFIEATVHAPYSYFQVIDVEPGEALALRDILLRREVRVRERSASGILQRGHIILARVVELGGICFFMGTGEQVILPGYMNELIALREYLETLVPKGHPLSDAALLEFEEDLRETYFDLGDAMSRPPDVRITDGDPLAFHTLTYEIPSFEAAFDALKDLEQVVMRRSDDEMLDGAERNRAGNPTGLTLHWLKKGSGTGIGDNTTLATLAIRPSKMTVEVNSERRSKRIQKEIRKRLGDEAVLLRTDVESHEAVMKKIARGPRKPQGSEEHDRLLRESPELRAQLKEMTERHWAAWLDEPVPALRGMTPRQAAKDPVGRELLESLLMDFALRNETGKDEITRVDISKLRRGLGMEGA